METQVRAGGQPFRGADVVARAKIGRVPDDLPGGMHLEAFKCRMLFTAVKPTPDMKSPWIARHASGGVIEVAKHETGARSHGPRAAQARGLVASSMVVLAILKFASSESLVT